MTSFADRTAKAGELRLQFPVSSGSQHKNKEDEWTPVEKTTATATKPVTTATMAPAPIKALPKPGPIKPPVVVSTPEVVSTPAGVSTPPAVSTPAVTGMPESTVKAPVNPTDNVFPGNMVISYVTTCVGIET